MTDERNGHPASPRWLSPLQQRVWRAYVDGSGRLMAELNRQLHRESGLTLVDYRILVLLAESPDRSLRMSDLAEGTLSSRSRLTHQIGRMEDQCLVRRTSCEEDGRGVRAHLTEQGMQCLRRAVPAHTAEVRRDFIDLLTPEQLSMLGQIFERIDAELLARTQR